MEQEDPSLRDEGRLAARETLGTPGKHQINRCSRHEQTVVTISQTLTLTLIHSLFLINWKFKITLMNVNYRVYKVLRFSLNCKIHN